MEKKEDEMKVMLDDLTDIIKKVYLPLMDSRPDQRLHMDQFVRGVYNSMEQAYGNITIEVPELPDKSNEELQNDKVLIAKLINTVVSLTAQFSPQIHLLPLSEALKHILILYLAPWSVFHLLPPFFYPFSFSNSIAQIQSRTNPRFSDINLIPSQFQIKSIKLLYSITAAYIQF